MRVRSTARSSLASWLLVPLAAGALGLLAACTPPQGEESTPSPGTSPSTEESTPSPSEGETPTETPTGASTGTQQFFRGLPPGVEEVPSSAGRAGAGWGEAERQLYVVTIGSSSCPLVGGTVAGPQDDRLTIELVELGGDMCTQDMVPTTSVVEVPEPVGRDTELAVVLGDLGEVTVPAWSGATEVSWLPNA